MDIEYVKSRLYGGLESFSLFLGQYSLTGLSCLLGGIAGLLGAFSTYLLDKSEGLKEMRLGKEDGKVTIITAAATRIPEGSSEAERVVADEVAFSDGESGDQTEVSGEELDNSNDDEEPGQSRAV